MKKQTKNKLLGIGMIVTAFGAGIAGGFLLDQPQPQVKVVTKEVPVITEKIVQVPVEKIVNHTIEVPVEKIVKVDNGNLDEVIDFIYDNDGDINFITDDLKDSEIDEIVDRIFFINNAKQMAIDEASSEGIDELHKEVVDGVKLDKHDIEQFRLYDDFDDVIVDDVYFDDDEAEILVKARFEQDDVKYKALFKVSIKDNEVDDIDLESVELRD